MIEAFLSCMRLLYPGRDVEPIQLRDMARVFAMGWCESAIARNDKAAVQAYADQFAYMAEPNWMPGDEWKWWTVVKLDPTK